MTTVEVSFGNVLITADVEVTDAITTNDNFIQYILTYEYSASYFATVAAYDDEVFDLTTVGQTNTYTKTFAFDPSWDLSKVTAAVIVQTNEGESTGGQYPITTREVLQASKATFAQDAVLSGIITDAFTNNPIPNATVTAGGFETTTTFNGTYTLNTIAQSYDVEVSHPNYETSVVNVTTVSNETTTLDISMQELLISPFEVYAEVEGGTVSLSWPYPEIPTALLNIEIYTDNYPAETSWDLVDDSGNVVSSIQTGDLSGGATLFTWDIELDLGMYTFTIYDSYGDGICCTYGNGYYNLILNGTQIATGGDFGNSESVTFEAVPSRTRDLLGYNVWELSVEEPLNGEAIVTEQAYTVEGLVNGTYSFAVSAVYSSGESALSASTVVEITGASVAIDFTNLADWNMVGLPAGVADPLYTNLYPNSVENTLFSFNGGYQAETELQLGVGYWLRFTEEGTNTITGAPVQSVNVSLIEGWNMIAGPSVNCDITSVDDPNGLIIQGTCYGFSNGYVNVTSVDPGYGYWLRSTGVGDIMLSGSTSSRVIENEDWLSKANTLYINNKPLYFGVEIPENELIRYSLPPKPPVGVFDLRFVGDYKVTETSNNIEVSGLNEQLIVSANLIDVSETWVLIDQYGYEYQLSDGSEFILDGLQSKLRLEKRSDIQPEKFVLGQNYPNPFNPVTMIDYSVSEEGPIQLGIYDLLGKEILTLVNEVHKPGNYQITFDGSNLSSGVYFYTLQTSTTTLTKKLILLK